MTWGEYLELSDSEIKRLRALYAPNLIIQEEEDPDCVVVKAEKVDDESRDE